MSLSSVAINTERGAIPTSHLFITGGTGFIGRHVVAGAISRGWQVTVLGRRPSPCFGAKFVPWDLASTPEKKDLARATCLIHLAADTRTELEAMPEDAEVDAARSLIVALPPAARVIFISSQSSNPTAPTRYGRTKARIESAIPQGTGVVIRPGMVYGGEQNAGLHSRLCGLVRRLPLIPDLRPALVVQPIHVEDLAEAILRSTAAGVAPGVYALADPKVMTMTAYLRAIARIRVGFWRPRVPIPAFFLQFAARFLASLLRILKVDPQNLIGLVSLKRMDTNPSLQAMKLELRPFYDGLRPSGSSTRRELLMEGHILIRYLSGTVPPIGVLKRYVLAAEAADGGQPLMLSMKFAAWPGLLRLIEDRRLFRRSSNPKLERRLDIATRVFEASTAGARQFMPIRKTSALVAGLAMMWLLGIELLWQGVGIVLRVSPHDHG
jgi:nucleoside-diphosphate-sugar epimerase